MSEGFLTSLATATLFFRVCRRYHIDGYSDRMALMRELVRRKKAKYVRDPQAFLAGKKVLQVKSGHNSGPEHWCNECGGRPKGDA